MTNYEKIKNMSIEEMVDFLAHDIHNKIYCELLATCYMHIDCNACYTKWLESEVTEE